MTGSEGENQNGRHPEKLARARAEQSGEERRGAERMGAEEMASQFKTDQIKTKKSALSTVVSVS